MAFGVALFDRGLGVDCSFDRGVDRAVDCHLCRGLCHGSNRELYRVLNCGLDRLC